MSMYFRSYGYLVFENETIAKQNFEKLISEKDTHYNYCPAELERKGAKIEFNTLGNFISYNTSENTCDLIYEVAEKAFNGNVKIDEGDGENSLWSWRSYKVRCQTLYYDHSKSQKSFNFKGEFQFESETLAMNACKMLTTDVKKSLFAKHFSVQNIFTDDKKEIYWKGNTLYVDVHCPGDEKSFAKTKKLINNLGPAKGKIICSETVCLRYIPVIGQSSTDWVNDMERSVFYHYSGNLTFNSSSDAERALALLLNNTASLFVKSAKNTFPVYVSGSKLFFEDRGECSRSLFNKTETVIEEIGVTALRGKVEAAFSIFKNMDVFVSYNYTPAKIRKNKKNAEAIARCKK